MRGLSPPPLFKVGGLKPPCPPISPPMYSYVLQFVSFLQNNKIHMY